MTQTATPTSTATPVPTRLSYVVVLPASVNLTAGQAQSFRAFACSQTGSEITDVTVTWAISPSVGSIASDGRYTAGSVSATTNVMIDAMVSQASTGVSATGMATAVVSPPPPPAATPTPIPPFTGPTPVPPIPPAGTDVQQLVLPDRITTVQVADPTTGQNLIDITVPAGTFTTPVFIQVDILPADSAEAKEAIANLPGTLLKVGDKIIEIDLVDADGKPITGPLLQPITIKIPYTDAEATAVGGAFNLRIFKYDEATKQWAAITTQVDIAKKLLIGQVTSLSFFTVGKIVSGPTPTATAPPATATATATATALPPAVLPSTGGVAPSGMLLGTLLAGGIALVLAGALYMRRRQQGKV
ncbi:MAG: hypothetical protein HYY34_04335 [Chloroflexi bacterium]|nr:hypothetical protein [Chloroflexota bacterium]